MSILTAIAHADQEREREIILMCYYLHYIPVFLYAVCTDVIELVPSSDQLSWELENRVVHYMTYQMTLT